MDNDSEEERDVYHENSYTPIELKLQPKNKVDEHRFFQPIPSTLLFHHQHYLSQDIHYYATHQPSFQKQIGFLCIHGAGHSALVFGQMAKFIRQSATLVSYDLMCHGLSKNTLSQAQMSMQNLVNEACKFWGEMTKIFKKTQKWILVGHSLGGCIVTHLGNKYPSHFKGIVLIDTIEGAALKNFGEMEKFIKQRPQSFSSMTSAIKWNYKAGCVKRTQSARSSVPSFFKAMEKQSEVRYWWKVNLMDTMPHWKDWFTGVSKLFVSLPIESKMVMTTSKYRLDQQLTDQLQKGKFEIVLFDHSGHNIQQDEYEKVCRILQSKFV